MPLKITALVFSGFTCVCGMFLNLLPVFRNRQLLAKMICSAMFGITGLLCFIERGYSSYSLLILMGLVFGIAGDYVIDCRENRKYLLPSALLFGICHVLYVVAFVSVCVPPLGNYTKYILALTGVMIIASILTVRNEQIRFPKGRRVMIVYALVLLVSFIVSFSRGVAATVNGSTAFGICLAAGSVMFILSDTFLAVEIFGKPRIPFTKHLINPFYFLAQTGFALSILFFNN